MMSRRTGSGLLLIIAGILLIDILCNLFLDSIGTYTYLFIPLPLIGVFYVFKDRKSYNVYHRRLSSLALVLIVVYFLLHLTLGLLYKFFFYNTENATLLFDVILLTEGLSVVSYASYLVAVSASEPRRRKWACPLYCLVSLLVLISVILVSPNAAGMLSDVENIREDSSISDLKKSNMFNEEISEYQDSLLLAKLPQIIGSIIVLIALVFLGKERLRESKEHIVRRFYHQLKVE